MDMSVKGAGPQSSQNCVLAVLRVRSSFDLSSAGASRARVLRRLEARARVAGAFAAICGKLPNVVATIVFERRADGSFSILWLVFRE